MPPFTTFPSRRWLAQHEVVERLNVAAHAHARANTDDFVLSAVLAHGKLPVLVAELLAAEAWREQILPQLLPQLLERAAASATGAADVSLRLYLSLYHEATLVNLLEAWLYHDYVVEVRSALCVRASWICLVSLMCVAH